MRKRILTVTGMMALTLFVGTTAFAGTKEVKTVQNTNKIMRLEATNQTRTLNTSSYGCGNGMGANGYGLMMDENGNLLSEKEFKKNLKKAEKDGLISKKEKEFYTNMYEYCAEQSKSYGYGC